MTCHVALSVADCAICFSDSQGTTSDQTESHGLQKLFVGPDFSIGYAGVVAVGNLLFEHLRRDVDAGIVNASSLTLYVKTFLGREVRPSVVDNMAFICATPSKHGDWIQTFSPQLFTEFSSRKRFGTIGSGSNFVGRAFHQSLDLGYGFRFNSPSTTFVVGRELIDAADESLTVDSTYTVAISKAGRCYLLGDSVIAPLWAPMGIQSHWRAIATKYEEMAAIAETIASEVRAGYRSIGNLGDGTLTNPDLSVLAASNTSISANLQTLTQQMDDFFVWYDGLHATGS